ncbi:(2Fe-2S)-binding protein [Egicoccus sp. AB-alg6-2]|uniref:(2Fe-2S)-binding protein n=1 Tax=Egicoccus sp. AB-alg6-2 TaxID=3242692 RepID=UPI00359DFB30
MTRVQIKVDGATHDDDVEPRLLLVHYLRDVLGRTGTNIGCDTSNCGACTVHLDGQSVKSCTILAVQADGAEVRTIEGLAQPPADGDATSGWHPLQKAFHTEHGLQCGYCTPGMIMSSIDLLERNPDPTEEEVRHGLEGNLCRCTGYVNIVRSVLRAAAELRGEPMPDPDEGTVGEADVVSDPDHVEQLENLEVAP